MRTALFIAAFMLTPVVAHAVIKAPAAQGKINPPTTAWKAKIEALAPAKPTAEPKAPRKVLVFSLSTGYDHKVAPHTAAVIEILGKKSGAFEVVHSSDIEMFMPENLNKFDAVVLNNTCSVGPRRNMFLDVLNNESRFSKTVGLCYQGLTKEQRALRAAAMEKSLLRYVASGKGLVCVHGGMVLLNNSEEFGKMIGGSFNFHPRNQKLTLKLVEPDHPLLAGFHGENFVHGDEPYLFHKAYKTKDFRPLLEMDVTKLDKATLKSDRAQGGIASEARYVAWIKPYKKGRVFYAGPSHQPESFETACMLQFFLDGIQYILGDLPCDDSPKHYPK